MTQKFTSAETSICKVGKVYSQIEFKSNSNILDYGCGKYNINKDFLQDKNSTINWFGIDKFNRTEEENKATLKAIKNIKLDYIILSNVLNVIMEDEIIYSILSELYGYMNKNTKLYIVIYEGDKSGNGKETSKGFQRNVKAKDYIKFIDGKMNVKRIKSNILEVTM